MLKKASLLLCVILITVSTVRGVQAVGLELALNVNEKYDLGEEISISGNLTLDGSPVTDGLVTIQIDDPQNDLYVLRTLNTGSTPSGPWPVEILELTTCDSYGNPQSDFEAGGNLGIKINVRNNCVNMQHVIVTVNLYDSNVIPFIALKLYEDNMDPESNETRTIWPIPIAHNAKLGQAYAYANALNGWPKNGGFAFSPEKSVQFNIGSTSGSGTQGTQGIYGAGSAGEFNLTFRTQSHGGRTGNYNVSAASYYQWWYATNQATFEVYLLGDLNGDGKVRVDDVLFVVLRFGTDEGGPPNSHGYVYDPLADLAPVPDGDGKIRVDDVLTVALAFGKYSEQ